MSSENTIRKQPPGRRFQPGVSGNPASRPKGAKNKSTLAAEALLDGEAEALTRKAVEMALGGDTVALRLCLERLMPPRRDRPVAVPLPQVASPEDATKAAGAVLAAVAEGSITPSEAVVLTNLIDGQRKAVGGEPPPVAPAPVSISVAFVSPIHGDRIGTGQSQVILS
jgi:uncharacterized protein DUF5681